MTTSPAGGWRDRVESAQHELQRVGLVASEAVRTRWIRLRDWLAGLLTLVRPRLDAGVRTLGTDLAVITGVEQSSFSPRLSMAARSLGRGGRRVAGALWLAMVKVLRLLRAAVLATGMYLSASREQRDPGAQVLAQPGDDVATILGRIDAASQSDVVLVVPRGVAALRTPAAWLRVAGHTRRRGLSLGVVAARADVRAYATQTGFDAARSRRGLPGARSYRALPRLGETVWPSVLSMLVGLVVLVGGLAYLLPTAQIEVAPASQPLEAELQVRINPLATGIDVPSRTLPATTVQRTVRAVVSAPATGSVRVGDKPAVARLEFRNTGSSPIEVPAGSVVRDQSRLGFATVEAVRIDPGQGAAVDSIAMRPGTVGNVGPGALRVMDDGSASLAVSNPVPAHGGTDRLAPGVSQADVDRVHRMAEDVLARVAVRQLAEEYDGGLVLPDAISIALLSQHPFQQLEEPSEVFVAEYIARASVMVVLPESARAFAERYLATLAPPGRDLVPGATSATFAAGFGPEGGRVLALVKLRGETAPDLEADALASAVAGANPSDAKALLRERLHLTSDPKVTQGPSWLPWPWLPRRSDRIEFVVVRPEPRAETAAKPSAP